ncbi:hypothetical protein MNBD_BACTEROID06-1485 [hydrothermal vent metagenome]|uniref:Uncharacterized protein n=1 Tax=hydrothermal vent metagenome TaxID=652676 RepID=A0A3B0V485_9ZZZZ
MSNFDKKAADWDKNHDHATRANKLAGYLAEQIDLTKVKKAMEYGSGTGLLSFALKNKIPSIELMDSSIEMTKAAQRKVEEQGIKSLHPVQYDIMTQELPTARYDLIFILQTLHHIDDTALFVQKSTQLLNPKGYLVIIDLVKEDGSFHEDEFHGHKGFVQTELEQKLKDSGLTPTHYGICHIIEKELEDGTIKEYPLFMMVGRK